METTTQNAYFAIQNKGEIDINAFRLLGASTKRGDTTKIGHFGSGLKYAIAVFLRNNVEFKIYSGLKEIKVSTSQQKLGERIFDVIKFNGRMTSLTTEMGIDWKLWFAVREVYCNAIDEGGLATGLVNELKPEQGKTTIFLKLNGELNEIFKNWGEYFSEKREDLVHTATSSGDKFFEGGARKLLVYRKGIQVLERDNTRALFHYDFYKVEINEARTIVSEFELEYQTVSVLKRSATEEMIARIYDNRESYEAKLNWEMAGFMSQRWLDVLGGRTIVLEDNAGAFEEEMASISFVILPNRLGMALKEEFKEKVKILGRSDRYGNLSVRSPQGKENLLIQECMAFLVGEIDVVKYPVQICDFAIESQMGEAYNEEILLSPKLFDKGKRYIVSTILEEYWHLESKATDKTRAFQDFLINRFIDQVETKKQIFL
jgi:hypothetical protein